MKKEHYIQWKVTFKTFAKPMRNLLRLVIIPDKAFCYIYNKERESSKAQPSSISIILFTVSSAVRLSASIIISAYLS